MAEQVLAAAVDQASVGIGVLSSDDGWLHANDRLCEILGYAPGKLSGLSRNQTTHPADLADETACLAELRRGQTASAQMEERYKASDGKSVWVSVIAARSRATGPRGDLLVIVQDIGSRRESRRGLSVQHLVSRIIVEAQGAGETISTVLSEVAIALRWSFAAYWEVDKATNSLKPAETWRAPGRNLDRFEKATRETVLPYGTGIPGRAWVEGTPTWEADVAGNGKYPRSQVAARDGLHSAFAFPIRTREKFFGVMEFFGEDVLPPDQALLNAAEGVGYQLGEYLERGRATEAAQASEIRKASILDTALDCIITSDADGVIMEFNPAAEATFGYRKADVLGRQMSELIIPPSLREAHRAGMKRYLATGEAHVLGRRIEITAMRSDGSEFPIELGIVRVPLPGPAFFTAYLRDLSERKRLEREQKFLLHASEELASSLDYETTIASIARLAVPDLADWCAVDVIDPDGKIRRVAVAHEDPEKVSLVQRLEEKYPTDPDATFGVPAVLRSGEPEYVADIPDSLLVQAARDAAHLKALRDLGLKSYLVVPLKARGQIFGALTLVYAESGRRFQESDLALATDLARRIGTSIENARLLEDSEQARHELEEQAAEMEIQATEMEQTQDQMEITNEELQTVNAQLRDKTDETRVALAAAEEANKAKSEFLATMSHELRTPLNAISGYAELLKMGIRGPVNDAQVADLERINRSQGHLLAIINDILKFAKLETGHLELKIEDFPIEEELSKVEELVRPQIDAKQLDYRYEAGDKTVRVKADRDRFNQILLNLVSNAVKFTPEKGSVVVSWKETGDRVRAQVADTGVGIPKDQLERIFDPFVQVDSGNTRVSEGVGLGLAISRDMAKLMEGDVTVESEPGKGSIFTLDLPKG